jgi:hypothetical protein
MNDESTVSIIDNLDYSHAEFLKFLTLHLDPVSKEIILDHNKMPLLWKYFINTRIKNVMLFCNEVNKFARCDIDKIINNLDKLDCIYYENNYNVSNKDIEMFKDEYKSSAYTLTPLINTNELLKLIN